MRYFAGLSWLWNDVDMDFEPSLAYEALRGMKGPFEGIDADGHVFIAVRLGSAGKIPVWACFSSGCKSASPVLGRGWRIPFFESRMEPVNDEWFVLKQPDGAERYFRKDRQAEGRLYGGSVWSGRMKGEEIRLAADAGDGMKPLELVFRRGRLAHLEASEGVYDFVYNGRALERVASNGSDVVRVKPDSRNPEVTTLQFRTSRVTCRRAAVPWYAGSAQLEDESTLVELVRPDGVKTFSYSFDGLEGEFLGAKTVKARWNVTTGFATAVNGWRYFVTPTGDGSPSIARIDSEGDRESFSFNRTTGLQVYEDKEGYVHTWKKFTSGGLVSRVRWYERTRGGATVERIDFSYDECARVVYCRIETPEASEGPRLVERWFDAAGRMTRERCDGKEAK